MSPKDEKAWNEMIAGYANELLDIAKEGKNDGFEPMSAFCAVLQNMADEIKCNWN